MSLWDLRPMGLKPDCSVILILAYPGTGCRKMLALLPESSIHLDSFGYREPVDSYWNWKTSIKVLKSRMYDARLKRTELYFIGWAVNWREIIECDFDSVLSYDISDRRYVNRVRNYRETEEYKWDQKLIANSSCNNFEKTINHYLHNYISFKAELKVALMMKGILPAHMYYCDVKDGEVVMRRGEAV